MALLFQKIPGKIPVKINMVTNSKIRRFFKRASCLQKISGKFCREKGFLFLITLLRP